MENQQEMVNQVKSLLPLVVKYQETKEYDSFDYGYRYVVNLWECEFFNSNGTLAERILTNTLEELLQKLSI